MADVRSCLAGTRAKKLHLGVSPSEVCALTIFTRADLVLSAMANVRFRFFFRRKIARSGRGRRSPVGSVQSPSERRTVLFLARVLPIYTQCLLGRAIVS